MLKLTKLPNRETAKISFTASVELKSALDNYAEIYHRTYGTKEGVTALIPFMLEAFINVDPGFKRARKELEESQSLPSATQTQEI